jgi:hypothetical protein
MKDYFNRYVHPAPLAVFRIGLGFLLLFGVVRFWSKGWIEELYIKPSFFFKYYGFEFVTVPGNFPYLLFIILGISSLLVAIGLYYRAAIITLFVSFTYIELIDKSTYLNHYYFISLICFMMIFLPAGVYFSIDAWRNKNTAANQIPQWTVDSIKLMVCILYVFAGIAKINSDWLLHAIPLKIWLPAKNDLPLIGFLFNYSWIHFLFSWFGCLYDLSIPFLLWNKLTRPWAYIAVVVFHIVTALLFPIGMFPYVMVFTALIFFSEKFHIRILLKISSWLKLPESFLSPAKRFEYSEKTLSFLKLVFITFFVLQLLMPLRYLFYPGKLFWTEQGYRFSWRVMLMEKAGYAQFKVVDSRTGKYIFVNNNDFLSPLQEKMMSTQPDMILQYAHYLRDYYSKKGIQQPKVYVEAYVALNGRLGKMMINTETDLAAEKDSWSHKPWVLPY